MARITRTRGFEDKDDEDDEDGEDDENGKDDKNGENDENARIRGHPDHGPRHMSMFRAHVHVQGNMAMSFEHGHVRVPMV